MCMLYICFCGVISFGETQSKTRTSCPSELHLISEMKDAKDSGEYLKDLLEKATDSLPNISEIRGRGLLIAVEFTEDIAPELVSTCNELGLLLNPVRPNAIRLMPPLTVSQEEMNKAVELIVEGVKTILAKGKE